MDYRRNSELAEKALLSTRAQFAAESKGRTTPEPEDDLRTCWQRDQDRVVHSKAFRRLGHKTQVFLAPEGDHYRVLSLIHISEPTRLRRISYAVFCLKTKKKRTPSNPDIIYSTKPEIGQTEKHENM